MELLEIKPIIKILNKRDLVFLITDIDGIIEYANPNFLEFTNYSKEDIIGNPTSILSLDKKNDTIYKDLWETILNGNDWQGSICNKKKNGDYYCKNLSISSIEGEDGQICNFIAIYDDVDSEDNYNDGLKTLFDNMLTGFAEHRMIYDDKGKAIDYEYLRINSAFEKQISKNPVGKTAKQFIGDIEDMQIDCYSKVVSTGESTTFDKYFETFNRYYKVAVFKTSKDCFATLFEDITDRYEAEKQVEAMSEMRRIIIDFSSNVSISSDISISIQNVIEKTGRLLKTDRIYIFKYDFENGSCDNTYEWCADGVEPQIDNLKDVPLTVVSPVLINKHKNGEVAIFEDVNKIQHEEFRKLLQGQDVKSFINIPMVSADDGVIGFLGLDSVTDYRAYTDQEISLLILFIQALICMQNREFTHDALEEGARTYLNLFENSVDSICLLDYDSKKVIACNTNILKLFKYDSKDQVIGKYIYDFAPKYQLDGRLTTRLADVCFKKVYDTGINIFEAIYQKSDGEVFNALVNIGVVSYEGREVFQITVQDVTEHKIESEKIRKSEERFRISTESAGVATWEWDILADEITGSDMYCKLFGIDNEVADIYKVITTNVHPDDRALFDKNIVDVLSGKTEEYKGLFRYKKSEDEEYRWLSGGGKVTERDESGAPLIMVGINQDVTKSIEVQEELSKNIKRLELATESGNIAVWEWYIKEDITIGSANYSYMFGLDPQQRRVYDEYWTKNIHPDDRQVVHQAMQDHLDGISDFYEIELRYKRPYDEDYRWIYGAGKITEYDEDSNPLVMMGIDQDITDQKKQQEEILISEQRLKLATESVGLAIWEYDIETDTAFVSEKYFDVYGFDGNCNKVTSIVKKGVHPDDWAKNQGATYPHETGKARDYSFEYRYKKPGADEYGWIKETANINKRNDDGSARTLIGVSRDITAQKMAEKEIRNRERDFRNIFESSTNGLVIVDAETMTVLDVNNAYVKMLNANSIDDFIGMPNGNAAPKYQPNGQLSSDYVKDKINQALSADSASYEYLYLTFDGKPLIGEVVVTHTTFRNKPALVISVRDITKHKEAQEAIRLSEIRLKQATSVAHIGLWDFNPQTGKLNISASWIDQLDYDNNPLIEVDGEWAIVKEGLEGFLKFIHPDETEVASKMIRDVLSGKIDAFDIINRMRKEDGSYIWVNTTGKITETDENGAILRVSGINVEIDKMKRAQEEIVMARKAAENVIDSSPIPLQIFDLENLKVLKSNKAYLDFMRIDSIESLPNDGALFVNNEDLHRINKRLVEDGYIDSCELNLRRIGTGEHAWVIATYNRINYMNQDCYVTSFVDMTEFKNTQYQLEIAKVEAEKASRIKGEFLANMSHEIRTPMNAVIGLNGLLEKTNLTYKQMDYVKKIGNAAKGLLKIINDILDYSKIESGKMNIEKTEFLMDGVLNDLTTVISFKAYEKDIEFLIKKDPRIPNNLIGDPFRLNQALLNLTSNAVKFTEKGEVIVAIDLIDDKDTIDIKFVVSDTGIGMTQYQKENLFKAFHQADASTTRKYGGTGLGLIITKDIVEMMGGSIVVESELGRGTSFSFIISFDKSQNTQKLIDANSKVLTDVSGLKILVADDTPSSRELIDAYLNEFEDNVVVVSSGVEAVEEASKQSFDLMILDWRMPGMDGIQAFEKIKSLESYDEKTKAILVTAYSYDETVEMASDVGFQAILSKPFTQSGLIDVISTVVGREKPVDDDMVDFKYPVGFDKVVGAKILLAEDNEINQQIVKELLEYEGFFVDLAVNGEQAADMIKYYEYDLVFMDLQMPVMDGYESAKKIRNELNNKTPIIALSADAMSGVQERVFEVGMDGAIFKPIDKQELFSILVKWIKPEQRQVNIVEIEAGITIDEQALKNIIKGVDVSNGLLRTSNNIKLYVTLLTKFAENHENAFDKVNKFIACADIEAAKKEVHTLKGVVGNIGATTLFDQVVQIEKKLKRNEMTMINDLISSAKGRLAVVVSQIKNLEGVISYGNLSEDVGNEDMSKDQTCMMLDELRVELENNCVNAQDICEKLLGYKFGFNKAVYSGLLKINQCILDFEFDEAERVCANIIEQINE